jgi:putative peptidoglycan lipid II flippase
MASKRPPLILKRVSIVTFFTALNLLASFLNQAVLAYFFGASRSMDALLISGALPFAVLNLAIGDLSYTLIPLLMRYEKTGDERRVSGACFAVVALMALGVSVLGAVGHRVILRLSTAASMPKPTFELAASIAPMIWIIVGLTILGSFLTGIHHYRRSFFYPAMTLALPYLGMIAGGLLGASRFGIFAVVAGWAVATLLRDLALYQFLVPPRVRFYWDPHHPAIAKLLNSSCVLGISLLPFAVLPVIDTFWASRLPVGSISYLGYSTRIIIALTGIVVQGLCVVLFTDLSAEIANHNIANFHRKLVGALDAILLSIVPLAVLVMVLRSTLVSVMLERGHFLPSATEGVIHVLPFYLLGMIFMAPMTIIVRAFYALGDYATPAKLGLAALALYSVASGLLVGRYSYAGIGMAYVIFWCFTLVVHSYALGNRVGHLLRPGSLAFLGKVGLSSLAAGGAVKYIVGPHHSIVARYCGPGGATGVGLVIFIVLTHYVFRVPQFRMLFSYVLRRNPLVVPTCTASPRI